MAENVDRKGIAGEYKKGVFMKIHITNLYGDGEGTAAIIAQQNVAGIAKELGFTEMSLLSRTTRQDTDTDLRKRMHGITAAVEDDDIIIFQSPTWQEDSFRYDKMLLRTIRFHLNVRIAIFIHDVIPFMFGRSEDIWEKTIEIYNMVDLIIVPSKAMLDVLREKGLKVRKVLIQTMFDFLFNGEIKQPGFQRQIFFPGAPDRFKFLKSWNYDIPIRLFCKNFSHEKQNIDFGGWKNTTELLTEYGNGGFGLIWEQSDNSDYYKCNQPYKLSSYLMARIPVIIQKGIQNAQIIQERGWGFAVESLEEAVRIVKNITEEQYYQLTHNTKKVSFLIKNGYFTKELLLHAVNELLMDAGRNEKSLVTEEYSFLKDNGHRPEALICTNSDQIEYCEELIKTIPQMHFHIAAFTRMSPKLMNMGKYSNVSLYPGIGIDGLDNLFEKCDYYFDINHQTEMASAVYRAFLSNQLIFAFENTIHNRKYVASSHIYSVENAGKMIEDIRAIMESKAVMNEHLQQQREAIF